jgi:hypothetical protein
MKSPKQYVRRIIDGKPSPTPRPPLEQDFEETMERAFPPHLRHTISGCCDSMDDGEINAASRIDKRNKVAIMKPETN